MNDCFTGLGWTPERNTKSYSEKDFRERVKQSEVEELGSSQSGCTRQKVLVRQRGGLIRLLTGAIRLDDDDLMPYSTTDYKFLQFDWFRAVVF